MRKSLLLTTTFVFCLVLLTPAIQAQSLIFKIQLDLNAQTLLATGTNLGPNPTVFMGNAAGSVDQLNVTNSGANFVIADLLTTDPGTYVVLVVNGASVGFADVTIGPVGPEGPPGPPGPDNPNIITEGSNTALGVFALFSNTTGLNNTATGAGALQDNTTGDHNTATGNQAMLQNTTGSRNTAMGQQALDVNGEGNNNTAVGTLAITSNNTGNRNTAMGVKALSNNTTGSDNIALGYDAGSFLTEGDNNIYIGHEGPASLIESDTIRMGNASHVGGAFIAGVQVVAPSSRRFKEDIHDMDSASSALMRLRPVTFRYKKAYANGEHPLQYGLIAEEVAEVYPELVVKNDEGQVQTVQYHKLNSMLLNEVQKQHRQIEDQQGVIADLIGRLDRLEHVLTTQRSLTAVAE